MSKCLKIILGGDFFSNDIRELVIQFFPDYIIKKESKDKADLRITVIRKKSWVNSTVARNGKVVEKFTELTGQNDRRQIKTLVYKTLSEFTGKELKWGTMTGIRPARIAHGKLVEGKKKTLVAYEIQREYGTDNIRTEDLIKIAGLEIERLYPLDKNKIQLYINIPFCPTRCSYCSFITRDAKADSSELEKYLGNLFVEISKVGDFMSQNNFKIESAYIGGGTPGILNCSSTTRLLEKIREKMPVQGVIEYTFEAGRPDTVTEDKLNILKHFGIDRISVNPQSLNEKTLKTIGRSHSADDFYKAYELARKVGFKTINCDMIMGLEGESSADMIRTAESLIALNPENITVHSLSVKKSSYLKNSIYKDNLFNDLEENEAAEDIYRMLKSKSYNPYYIYRQKYTVNNGENIGFSKKGHEGYYNLAIMSDKRSIVGLGAGSTGKIYFPDTDRFERMETVKNIDLYNKNIESIAIEKIKQIKSLTNNIDMI